MEHGKSTVNALTKENLQDVSLKKEEIRWILSSYANTMPSVFWWYSDFGSFFWRERFVMGDIFSLGVRKLKKKLLENKLYYCLRWNKIDR